MLKKGKAIAYIIIYCTVVSLPYFLQRLAGYGANTNKVAFNQWNTISQNYNLHELPHTKFLKRKLISQFISKIESITK